MDTKKSIDWKREIPRITQPDGTVVYDCDIFGGDKVNFEKIDCLRISGNLAVGKYFSATSISVGEDAFIGEDASICNNIEAIGDVYLGDNCNVVDIIASGSIYAGNLIFCRDIYCNCNVSFGDDADACNVWALGDVSFGSYADVKCVVSDGNVSFKDNAYTGDVTGKGDISFGIGHSIVY